MLLSRRLDLYLFLILNLLLFSCEEDADTKTIDKQKKCQSFQSLIKEPSALELKKQLKYDDKIRSAQILKLINKHRKSIGLKKLKPNKTAKFLASKHNDFQIIEKRISHNKFEFRTCFLMNVNGATTTSENLASGFKKSKSVVERWLKSNIHKKNIESDFSFVGIAVTKDSNNKIYYSSLFYK